MIHYLEGDATDIDVVGEKMICHVCNDIGGWGKGFVVAISDRWSEPEADFRHWHSDKNDNDFALGSVQFVQVEADVQVVNMIAQHGIRKGKQNTSPIRYGALSKCLREVAKVAEQRKASIHMPRIGCGLAGGKWDMIEPIIEKSLLSKDVKTIIYDFG